MDIDILIDSHNERINTIERHLDALAHNKRFNSIEHNLDTMVDRIAIYTRLDKERTELIDFIMFLKKNKEVLDKLTRVDEINKVAEITRDQLTRDKYMEVMRSMYEENHKKDEANRSELIREINRNVLARDELMEVMTSMYEEHHKKERDKKERDKKEREEKIDKAFKYWDRDTKYWEDKIKHLKGEIKFCKRHKYEVKYWERKKDEVNRNELTRDEVIEVTRSISEERHKKEREKRTPKSWFSSLSIEDQTKFTESFIKNWRNSKEKINEIFKQSEN